VQHIRFFLAYDEVASLVFGQAGLHLGQNFGVLAVGVELLAGPGRARATTAVIEFYARRQLRYFFAANVAKS